jgi:thiamine biosynthesis lipoprotein ApbE
MLRSHLFTASALALLCPFAVDAKVYTYHHENVLGTELELRFEAPTEAIADAAEARALAEIERLAGILSGYDANSELRRWQAAESLTDEISSDLMAVLQACDTWRERSGGAFEPAVAALIETWRAASNEGRRPTSDELATAKNRMESTRWRLDAASGTALHTPGATVTLDGLAKGYIVDRACDAAMLDSSVSGTLVNIGGDLRAAGVLALEAGIANPFADSESTPPIARVPVMDGAVATSGNYQRFTEVDGERLSHIFDPRTGQPVTHVASATAIAPRSTDADALATALNVLSPAEGVALADSINGAACLIVASDGAVSRSARWTGPAPERIRLVQAEPTGEGVAANDTWSGRYELAVNFEVANPETEGQYRRPYVGIWICDHEGFPIRTLLLWQQKNGLRWLPDLREWYRDDQIRSFVDETDLITTMSRATRPPGKYDVIWDGKDDAGVEVPTGNYTLRIEATREHGTHQTITAELALGGEAFETKLEGNVEISQASIQYRPVQSAN